MKHDLVIPSVLSNMRPTSWEINLQDVLGMFEIFINSEELMSFGGALEKGELEIPL